MEGYRASLILCLPEFDTYHILAEYARYPESRRANLGYQALLKRATMMIRWRVYNSMLASADNIEEMVKAYLGSRDLGDTDKPLSSKHIPEMNENELMDFYNKAMDMVGLTVDPETLARARQEE